jgi:hypothetical protein
MKRAFRSHRGLRVLAALLALLFVFPPEAMARMSCATLALFSVPMRCCAMRSAGADAAAKPCCCTAETETASSLGSQASVPSKVRGPDGCCCTKAGDRDVSTPPKRDATTLDLSAWIAERAQVSARALHFDGLAIHVRSHSDRDGPVPGASSARERSRSSPPSAGCTRHGLVARGVVGLLTDFGIALL